MKIIIVGGVASGASCVAHLYRLDENVEIIKGKGWIAKPHSRQG